MMLRKWKYDQSKACQRIQESRLVQFEVYLLSIEMARDHIYASQQKHVLELLKFGIFGMQTENYIHQSESEVGCSHFKNNYEQGTISEIGGNFNSFVSYST